MKNYLLAITTLMGTIIGVGMFTLPYVTVKSGVLLLFLYLPLLAFIQNYLHLLFAEIVLSTDGDHRLPGYAAKYGGRKGKIATLILALASDYGVLVAYIIFGGVFLHQLLNPVFGGSVFIYATSLFFLQAVLVFFGLKTIAGSEFIMTTFMVLIIAVIAWRGWDAISLSHFALVDWQYVLYPYGPIFFAVGGAAAIPEVCKLLADQPQKIKSAISWGTYLAAAIMLLFVLTIVGITGANTTPDALAGLSTAFDGNVAKLALIFGLLAVITSLMTIAQACREIFWWDFKVNKHIAWFLACVVPYLIYAFGLRNLTKVVSLTGAFSGGMLGLIMILIVWQIKKKCDQPSPITNFLNQPIAYGLATLFILGLVYETWATFFRI